MKRPDSDTRFPLIVAFAALAVAAVALVRTSPLQQPPHGGEQASSVAWNVHPSGTPNELVVIGSKSTGIKFSLSDSTWTKDALELEIESSADYCNETLTIIHRAAAVRVFVIAAGTHRIALPHAGHGFSIRDRSDDTALAHLTDLVGTALTERPKEGPHTIPLPAGFRFNADGSSQQTPGSTLEIVARKRQTL